ncbi:MAG: TetR/AcrR family transcriptional regulator [Bacillota bacterium]|nr:TetR/AcrR family transcriptional regulator [Bacillota bacterium]
MQIQKEFIRKRIIKSATKEFLNADYHKASLRKIAAAADITPGNIYRYFEDKAALYKATVAPAWNGIQELFHMAGSIHYSDYSENTVVMITNELAKIFILEQDGFMILIKNDPHSPITDVRETLISMIQTCISDNMAENTWGISTDPVLIGTLAISITESMIYIFQKFDGNIPLLKKRLNITLDLLLNSFQNSLEREIRYAVTDPIL